MARPVVLYPDPLLKKKSRSVTDFDDTLKVLAADMVDTMRSSEGLGLSAVQVGELLRVMIMEVGYDREDRGEPLVLVNPEILESSGTEDGEEGCLSFPGIRENVERAAHVKVRARDLEGREVTLEYDGLLARCVQHEVDHMNGHLFVERVPYVKRLLLKSQLKELEKQYKTKVHSPSRRRSGV